MIGLEPGSELGGFVIEAVAGRGGMGVVYRARQLRPSRTVALKVISPQLAEDPAFRARFERESEIAAQIEHPNVIPVYAVDEDGGVLYIAMRYVEGTDLRDVVSNRGRLDPQHAAVITDQVARALDAAHARGLVHRDVKPSNVLLATESGGEHPYLTDFGLARHVDGGASGVTATGVMVGTIDYVAPEQVRGDRVDARTDVYSLGCMLFECLTGKVPFPRDNDIAKLYAHSAEPPPSVRDQLPELPAALDEVLARAMAKDPVDRYLSAGDFGRAAVAASANERLSRAERSVAQGAAAPIAAAPVQRAVEPPSEAEESRAPTAARHVVSEPQPPPATAPQAPPQQPPASAPAPFSLSPTGLPVTAATPPAAPKRRTRWPLIAGIGAAVAVAIAVVVILVAGGGGKDESAGPALVPPGDRLVEKRDLTATKGFSYTVALSVPEAKTEDKSAAAPLTMSLLGARGDESQTVIERKELPSPPYTFAQNSYVTEFQLSPNPDGSGSIDLSWIVHPGDTDNKTCYFDISFGGIQLNPC